MSEVPQRVGAKRSARPVGASCDARCRSPTELLHVPPRASRQRPVARTNVQRRLHGVPRGADLAQFVKGSPAILDIKRVTQFAPAGHPYFRSLGDPERGPAAAKPYTRQLKFASFSHRLHMSPGMAYDGDHQVVLTLGRLTETDRMRYGAKQQSLYEPVQLNCDSCHQSGDGRSGAWKLERSASGPKPHDARAMYGAPIVYENHCAACHPLTITSAAGAAGETAGKSIAIAHRLPPAKLADEIERYWQDRFLKEHPESLTRRLPLPGAGAQFEKQAAGDWINERYRQSASHVNRVCGKCHQLTDRQPAQPPASRDAMVDAVIPRVAPLDIPRQFLAHAQFDHSPHRAVACIACHQDAFPPVARRESFAQEPPESPLMIANRDKCLECHAPQSAGTATASGGARFDCAECHRYHNHEGVSRSP